MQLWVHRGFSCIYVWGMICGVWVRGTPIRWPLENGARMWNVDRMLDMDFFSRQICVWFPLCEVPHTVGCQIRQNYVFCGMSVWWLTLNIWAAHEGWWDGPSEKFYKPLTQQHQAHNTNGVCCIFMGAKQSKTPLFALKESPTFPPWWHRHLYLHIFASQKGLS